MLLLLICFVVELHMVKGANLTLTGSANYAVLDQTFRFTCTLTDDSSTEGILTFNKVGQASSCGVMVSTVSSNPCTQVTTRTDYTCGCVTGQTGVYYMNISRVSVTEDEATWSCQRSPNKSNNITLPVYYGPYSNVTINQNSPVTVIEDVNPSQTARCSAVCKPACSYSWRKGTQEVSDHRDLSLGGFRRGQEGDYTCRAVNRRTGETADNQTLTVEVQWYPAQPTHNCPDWIVLGQTGSCTCQTSDRGKPAGRVEWRNPDNQQISSSPSSSVQLSLPSIPRSENGRGYICRASNSLQNRTEAYTVNIAFGPAGVSISGNQQTNAPDDLTLTCTTTDLVNPEPTLIWRNLTDGAVLSGSSPAQVGSPQDGGYVYSFTLSISTRWYQDGDSLVCEGRNSRVQSLPTVTDSVVLDINYAPVSAPVISGLSSSPVYEGDTLTLTCRVSGGKPHVTSVKLTCPGGHQNSSTRTEGSNTRLTSLTFPAPRQLRFEPCRCSAVHTTGRYQLTDEVTKDDVYYPPSIQRLSLSRPLPWLAGQSETLTCELSNEGHPSATYVWYRDNQRMTDQTGVSWELSPLSYTDNGRATQCQAENQFTVHKNTPVKSSTQTLNVYYAPRVNTTPANSVTTKEGDSLSVHCTADSNPDPSNYQWTHGSVNKPSGHQLDIADLDRSDHGEYRCTVTTQAGIYGALSGTTTLQVVVNFSPDLRVTNVTETENQSATVACSADGRPENFTFSPFLHTWKGHVIRHVTGQKTGGGREYQKVFPSSSFQDSGVYVCAVENGVPNREGELVHKANISVQIDAPPKLTADQEMETSVGAELRENITLFRTFYSRTSITSHSWSREGRALNNSQMSPSPVQLDIHGVLVQDEGSNISLNVGAFDNERDAGEYELEVCNTQGCLTSKINLTPAGPPSAPTDFKVLNTTQTSVFLSWRAGFAGGPYTQVFVVEYRTEGGAWKEFGDSVKGEEGETVLTEVTGLSQGTRYEFRVFARNTREIKNKSEYSASLEEITKEKPPEAVSGALIGGVSGAVVALLIIVAVVVVVLVMRRRTRKDDESSTELHRREQPEMQDNVLYASSGSVNGRERPVMEDNVLYATSGNVTGVEGGAEYAVVQKKTPGKKQKDTTENVSDVYATPFEKKGKEKKGEDKKGEKRGKKEDKKKARTQKRVEVYENTVPGQFGVGTSSDPDANTYANAAFVNDDGVSEENPKPPTGRDADGCLYVGIDFGNQKPGKVIIGDEKSPYADIAFGRVGPPPTPDEEEENKKKDTASK